MSLALSADKVSDTAMPRLLGWFIALSIVVLSSNLIYLYLSCSGTLTTVSRGEDASRSVMMDYPSLRQQTYPSSNSSTTAEFHYFYNIFVPPINASVSESMLLEMVREQIELMGISYAATNYRVHVHYNTIGRNHVVTERFMVSECAKHSLTCIRHHEHYEQCHEHATLQALYEFCVTEKPYRVGYFHTKGSLNIKAWNGGLQDPWRRHGTRAVVHELCVNATSSCNVCSIKIVLQRYPHATGNFFGANCDYVSQLIPPMEFDARMHQLVETRNELMRKRQRFNLIVGKKDVESISALGLGRYSAEHWIGSHPDFTPCDLSKAPRINFWQGPDRDDSAVSFGMLPRGKAVYFRKEYRSNQQLRLKEYCLLGGYLFKWYTLYHKAPKNTSYVWDWFPDGSEWLDAVQKHGVQAIDLMAD